MKRAIKPVLFLLIVFTAANAPAQCPSSGTAWMERIVLVEAMDNGPDKLRAVAGLLQQHAACKAPKDSVLARILHRLGNQYLNQLNDAEKSIAYTRQAVAINSAQTPGALRSFLAGSYFNLGVSYASLNLLPEAINYYDSCIDIARQYDNAWLQQLAYYEKVFTEYRAADYQKAIETADKGILLARQLADTLYEAGMQLQKAQALLEWKRTAEAGRIIQQTMPILLAKGADKPRLATGYSIYAKLLNAQQQPAAAAAYYKKAFDLNIQAGKDEQSIRDMLDLGRLYDENLNNLPRAIACFNEGLKKATAKWPVLAAGLYINMGSAYWHHKDYRKALACYQQALASFPIGFTGAAITDNPTAAMLRLSGNDYFLYTLLANKGEALLDLAKQEKQNSLLNHALATFRLADKLVDQMRRRQYREQSKLFWRGKTKKMYEQAIETCYLLQLPEDAFYFFEKSRAVLLNDKLNELGAARLLPPSEVEKEKELRLRMLSLQQQLSAGEDSKQRYYAAQDEFEKFIKALEKNYGNYYHYKYDTAVQTVAGIRQHILQQDKSLISYFTGDSAIYILSVTPAGTGFEQVRFPGFNTLAQQLLLLVSDKSLLNRQYRQYTVLAYTLYDRLFKQLDIPTARVIISPDEHFIPFELLVTDSAAGNSFLIKKHAFSYTYSAGFLARAAQSPQPLHSRLLGIAPVTYQPRLALNPLDGADASLKNIGKTFSSADYLLHGDATRKHFLQQLPAYPVVHLYSHASADSLDTEPVLYFADSALRLTELQALGELNTRLMVLSACNTGLGKNIRGEGVFSLARGFAAAGIPATVANLWQIDNQATYKLTELFYQYLNKGLPGDEALQKAKLDFLQAGQGEEMPYYWAASVFMGKPEMVQQDKPRSRLLYISAAAALLLGAGLLYWKRKRKSNA